MQISLYSSKYPTPKCVDDDKKFRDEIVSNNPTAVGYFLKDYSVPILKTVGSKVYNKNRSFFDEQRGTDGRLNYYNILIAPYYELVSVPLVNGKPDWKVLRNYKGINDARLHNYLILIFSKNVYSKFIRPFENLGISKIPKSGITTIGIDSFSDPDSDSKSYNSDDKIMFNILIDNYYDEDEDSHNDIVDELNQALQLFGKTRNGKDYLNIINLSIYENYDTMAIAELLGDRFAKPLEDMTDLQIRKTVSQWKQRALEKFAEFILDKRNIKNFPNLLELVTEKLNN